MSYSKSDHCHNFAVWAAARAAQRRLKNGTTYVLKKALEDSGLKEFADDFKCKNQAEFNDRHIIWCEKICSYLTKNEVPEASASYGRAAKLVNVYLKSRVVLPDLCGEPATFIHPPVDNLLLKTLREKRQDELSEEEKSRLKKATWTTFTKEEYFQVIEILRKLNKDKPFWMIEEYWPVT